MLNDFPKWVKMTSMRALPASVRGRTVGRRPATVGGRAASVGGRTGRAARRIRRRELAGFSPVLGLDTPHFGAKLEDPEGGRVVDPDRKARQIRRSLGETAPVFRLQEALTQAAEIDAALGADHAGRELLARHLQGKDGDAVAGLLAIGAVVVLAGAG